MDLPEESHGSIIFYVLVFVLLFFPVVCRCRVQPAIQTLLGLGHPLPSRLQIQKTRNVRKKTSVSIIENNVCYSMWQLYTNLRIQCDNYSQNQPRKNPMWQVHTKSTLVSFVTFIQEKGHFSITCLNYTENKLL